jgi:hypothetical protein
VEGERVGFEPAVQRRQTLRTVLWVTALLLLSSGVALVYFLLRAKLLRPPPLGEQSLGLPDAVGIVSLALSVLLFFIAIFSLYVAVVTYVGAEKSSHEQQVTLEASRKALEETSGILKKSANDFRDSAEAARGQYDLLQGERVERDESVLVAIRNEVTSNLAILEQNQQALQQELALIPEGKTLVAPLLLLHTGSWELLKVNIPERFFKEKGTLNTITDAFAKAGAINETVRSRENYRINNGAMTNFSSHMKLYDDDLIPKDTSLIKVFKELRSRALADEVPKPRQRPEG